MTHYDLTELKDAPEARVERMAMLAFRVGMVAGLVSVGLGLGLRLAIAHPDRLILLVSACLAGGGLSPAVICGVFLLIVASPELVSLDLDVRGLTFTSSHQAQYRTQWDHLPWNFSLWYPVVSGVGSLGPQGTPYRRVFMGKIRAVIPLDAFEELRRLAEEKGFRFLPQRRQGGWMAFMLHRGKQPRSSGSFG